MMLASIKVSENTKSSSNENIELKYKQVIDVATNLLLYRRFEDCLTFCQKNIMEIKNYIEEFTATQMVEALTAMTIQAYAELNRWQEVIPFVAQIYNGIEDCPIYIVKLCFALHAQLKDHVTCTVITNIWLRHSTNFTKAGYQSLVELYIIRILLPSFRWDDVGPFLDSCPGLDSSVKETYLRQVRTLRHEHMAASADEIEVIESGILTAAQGSDEATDFVNNDSLTEKIANYTEIIKSLVEKYFPIPYPYVIRNICIIATVLYLLFTRWRPGFLSSPVIAHLLTLLQRLWRGMFTPFYPVQ